MIRELIALITKVLDGKLVKSGIESEILKNQNYITEAKKIWYMVDENHRISTTIEEKIKSKADEFAEYLLAKFPELSQDDIVKLRQSVAGEINKDKAAVIDNSTLLQQLQASNTQLQTENASLKDQLAQVKSLVTPAQQAPIDNTQNVQTAADNTQATTTQA
jgi:regulator of replication initiation timing